MQYAWNPQKAMDKENVCKTIDAEELTKDRRDDTYRYACPCGDGMKIPLEKDYVDLAICPSCCQTARIKYSSDSQLNSVLFDNDQASDDSEESSSIEKIDETQEN